MAKPIQILAGESLYIHGFHSKPTVESSASKDSLLIIMAHGFPGNKSAHDNIFANLDYIISGKNYHTLQFDFRGCGESDGREEDFTLASASQDFQNVLAWAKDQGYTRFMFICEGLGAPVALMNAPEQALCYILLWPMLDMPLIAKTIFKADEIEEQWKKAGYALIGESRIGVPFIEQLDETEIVGAISNLNKPMLIMHGAEDKISPIGQLDIVRKHAKGRRVEITSFQDGEHGLPQSNHRKAMFFHIMQFIEKYA